MSRRAARITDDAGVIAPATAALMAVLIGMVGLVTDTSVWFAQRRQLQGVTDAAALAAAAEASKASARATADAILTRNGVDPAKVVVAFETGFYCPDAAAGVAQRFRAAACADGSSGTTANAVRIATTIDAPLLLSRLFLDGSVRRIDARATAARVNQAGIEAGSGVASVDGGIANAVLSSLTGGSIALSAAQYDGLLKTRIDALTFLDALATRLNVTTGTYSQLLQSNARVGDVIDAEIAALAGQSQVAGAAAAIAGLQGIRSQIAGNPTIALGKLFDLGLWSNAPVGGGGSPSALHAGLNPMQLTSFSLQLANGSHVAQIPAGSVGVPGLASVAIAATAIEPPVRSYFSFGPEGTRVHTAQVRVKLDLGVLGLTQQLGTGISVPLYIEAGSGDARIDSISCIGDPARDARVLVTAHSGVADAYIGTVDTALMKNFTAPVAPSAIKPVQILSLGVKTLLTLAETKATAHVTLGSTTGAGTTLAFAQPAVAVGGPTNGTIGRPATATAAAVQPVTARATSTGVGQNLLGGLAETLEARVCTISPLGLCLLPFTAKGSQLGPLYTVLDPVLTGLDPLLDSLLRSLGIEVGYVDVAVTGVRCGLPVLVS